MSRASLPVKQRSIDGLFVCSECGEELRYVGKAYPGLLDYCSECGESRDGILAESIAEPLQNNLPSAVQVHDDQVRAMTPEQRREHQSDCDCGDYLTDGYRSREEEMK